jgi:hypothetical protein
MVARVTAETARQNSHPRGEGRVRRLARRRRKIGTLRKIPLSWREGGARREAVGG